jgi:hypothetical protein
VKVGTEVTRWVETPTWVQPLVRWVDDASAHFQIPQDLKCLTRRIIVETHHFQQWRVAVLVSANLFDHPLTMACLNNLACLGQPFITESGWRGKTLGRVKPRRLQQKLLQLAPAPSLLAQSVPSADDPKLFSTKFDKDVGQPRIKRATKLRGKLGFLVSTGAEPNAESPADV